MAHFEKKLSSEVLFSGRVVTLSVDKVELENQKNSTREVIHHNGGASVIALTDSKEIFLIKQFRYPFGEELWEIPAGKLEKGEDPFLAAKRELKEETGLEAEKYIDLGEIYPTVGYCTEIIYIYLATNLTKSEQNLDEGEFVTVCKVPFEKAYEMVINGEIKDSKTVMALFN